MEYNLERFIEPQKYSFEDAKKELINGKTYDYLYTKGDVNIGDKLKINRHGQLKNVVVQNIKFYYEDELPLPIEKMGKI